MDLSKIFWVIVGLGYCFLATCIIVITSVRRFKLCNGNIVDLYGEDRLKERISYLALVLGLITFVALSCETELIVPLRLLISIFSILVLGLLLDFSSWVSQLAKKGFIYERLYSVRRKGRKNRKQAMEIGRKAERDTIHRYGSDR